MVKKLIFLSVLILVFTLHLGNLSATIPNDIISNINYFPHKANTSLVFSVTSNNASQCNVTGINTPSTSYVLSGGLIMTKTGQTFNFSIDKGNFTTTGTHCIHIICMNGATRDAGSICREVSNTGNKLDISQVLMYALMFVGIFFVFLLTLYGSLSIPLTNMKAPDGEILSINWKKYLKLFCVCIAYVSFVWIIFLSWNLSWAYLQMQGLSTFFKYIFYLVFALTFPVFAGIIILGIVSYHNDKRLEKYMDDFSNMGG